MELMELETDARIQQTQPQWLSAGATSAELSRQSEQGPRTLASAPTQTWERVKAKGLGRNRQKQTKACHYWRNGMIINSYINSYYGSLPHSPLSTK